MYGTRRGSRINTDRFPKPAPKAQASRDVPKRAPPGNFLDFHSLKSPFLDFIVIQTGYWLDSNSESIFIIKNIFVMKIVTDFRKTVETGVDPRLGTLYPFFQRFYSVLDSPGRPLTVHFLQVLSDHSSLIRCVNSVRRTLGYQQTLNG